METGGALLTELLECDIVKLESSKVLRYFPPGNGNLSDLEHNPLKSENTMDRRVEIKKNPTKSKTARVKDNERGETNVDATKQQAVERKGDKGGKSEIPIEELSREKGKKKQGRTESDKKERKRWEAAPEYFQFLALHWHAVSAAQPALDGSQVQSKMWKKWVRGETPKPVRPRAKEEPTRRSVEVMELDENCLADFFCRGISPSA